ncbi:uncharacterized protein BYT42DRAFT_327120 [Radiomyces spectabilis]|uniref:uncharacterized protein n=1 Tax=Radiomyces spectabilis TaxID=64574 RepID=UPI00221F6B6E|nr:uncharacterized protein BYT42DRAFT_327120 [Radiomyces spectabilis]KAI8379445.1 hypothetical protein BYT42DRAFT_327120 [Radiomyces spectabilis]
MTNSTDAWDEYTYQTPVFRFAYHQFLSLKKVNIALSILSVVGSALIIVAFLYLFFRERKRTNRISLRCVFFCAIADTLNAMLDIVIINYRGNTEICRTSGVIIIFTKIISAALLAIVGINFVLIFVLNIKQRDRLEYYYYAGTLVYSTVTLIFPIIAAVRNDNPTQLDNFTCWYLVYINDRTHNYWSWVKLMTSRS